MKRMARMLAVIIIHLADIVSRQICDGRLAEGYEGHGLAG